MKRGKRGERKERERKEGKEKEGKGGMDGKNSPEINFLLSSLCGSYLFIGVFARRVNCRCTR